MKNFLENYKFLTIVLIATFFGLASGFVGQMVARVYLFENTFDVPFFTQIDFRGNNNGSSGIIIRNPKKVVIEQNEKVDEIVNSVSSSIIGIYKKSLVANNNIEKNVKGDFDLNNYYKNSDRVGEAFVMTSDGWLISNFTPVEKEVLVSTTSRELSKKVTDEFIVISNEKKIYNISSIVVSEEYKYSFWKIDSKDLPVKEIARGDDIKSGQLLIGIDIKGRVELANVKDIVDNNETLIKSTDGYYQDLILSASPSKGFFYFNLAGGVVGFSENQERLVLIESYAPAIDYLSMKEKIGKTVFGVNYIPMVDLVATGNEAVSKGAIIYKNEKGIGVVKNSIADKAGLKMGDIITSVNNVEINKNNDLAYILSFYRIGDSLDIEYVRNGESAMVEIKI